MKISEVNIQFIKPSDGLIGFASLVIDDAIYLGSIAIHQKFDGTGYRLTYPTKKSALNQRPVFHPICREASLAIEQVIFSKLKNVMSKIYDRHGCSHTESGSI